ncbi:hypothetical protein CERSUDRAFT_88251 [Gelatoporia subvermispora B]|uniref:Uncharacterized protein n=1 Tax=Ceriporiopsis subvermispora (strain B) TaxID=914234 RepID=M2QJF9_CERS8|nr:hypothetical protein CERSUDRAFT_88251 [Gelatoporia subvermispora B]
MSRGTRRTIAVSYFGVLHPFFSFVQDAALNIAVVALRSTPASDESELAYALR